MLLTSCFVSPFGCVTGREPEFSPGTIPALTPGRGAGGAGICVVGGAVVAAAAGGVTTAADATGAGITGAGG